ncbi:MAG: hypothetical protein IJU84_04125, partial [Clostridia bacterium]|nr:hypothetical protein [Clostridia bacterium]
RVQGSGGPAEIPTIDDYFGFIKDRDGMVLLVELKTADAAVPSLLKAKIDEYGVDDKIIIISAFNDRLDDFRKLVHNVSTGGLNSYKTIEAACTFAYMKNASFGPGINYIDDTEVMTQAIIRGIPVYSWTFGSVTKFEEYMFINTSLTSDSSGYAKEQYVALETDAQSVYTITENASVTVNNTVYRRMRKNISDAARTTPFPEPEVTLAKAKTLKKSAVSYSDTATYSAGKLNLKHVADGYEIVWFTAKWQSIYGDRYYYVNSKPIKIVGESVDLRLYETEISESAYVESKSIAGEDERPAEPLSESAGTEKTGGCNGAAGGESAVIAAVLIIAIAAVKRRSFKASV